jgi:hypothetical protein
MSSFPGSPRILKGGIVLLDMGITLSGSDALCSHAFSASLGRIVAQIRKEV